MDDDKAVAGGEARGRLQRGPRRAGGVPAHDDLRHGVTVCTAGATGIRSRPRRISAVFTDAMPRPMPIAIEGLEASERRETHGAWVLLAGGRAYKIKKPVRFSFLDYSTLE